MEGTRNQKPGKWESWAAALGVLLLTAVIVLMVVSVWKPSGTQQRVTTTLTRGACQEISEPTNAGLIFTTTDPTIWYNAWDNAAPHAPSGPEQAATFIGLEQQAKAVTSWQVSCQDGAGNTRSLYFTTTKENTIYTWVVTTNKNGKVEDLE